ncbi:MAG: CvpA family protein [Rubricoccaceae bacterium]|nr:CvpA family protein [Rubricoccaceae bacterium]
MSGLSTIDIVILALVGTGVWRGFRTGMAKQLLGTLGLFLAFIVGAALMGPIGQNVVAHLGISERTAPIVGFIVIFTGVLSGVAIVGYLFRKALETIKLKSLDNLGGAVLGGIKAAISLSIMLLVTGYSPVPGSGPWLISEEERRDSILAGPVESLAPELWTLIETITPGIQDALVDKFNSWQEAAQRSTNNLLHVI